ncbi:MAG: ChaN family lipoprotein [Gallionella sp.]
MKIIAIGKLPILILLLLIAVTGHAENMLLADHPLAGKIWDMRSGSFMDETALLARIGGANVVLLGETHDNPLHHDIQLRLLKALIASGARPALLMEQLDSEAQAALDVALANSNRDEALSAATRLIKFTDWKSYRPFLAIAIENGLPVIAANIPSQQLQPVVWYGFSAYDAAALKRMHVEAVWNDSRENYMLQHIGGAHCGRLRESLRAGLTRSQRLRDALMADAAMKDIGRGIVAIVGSSHARRDVGMPLYLAARDPSARILSVGLVEVIPGRDAPESYEAESASGDAPFDVVWFTPRVARIDPCAELEKK